MNNLPVPTGDMPVSQPQRGGWVQSSYDLATRQGQIATSNAVNGRAMKLQEADGKTIEIVHVVRKLDRMANEQTGELVDVVRMVFVCPTGTRYVTFARSAYEAVDDWCNIAGCPPWDPPLRVKVELGRLDNGRNWYYFELLGDGDADGKSDANQVPF